jgi:tetratricopeptide (TPR) repeat protein
LDYAKHIEALGVIGGCDMKCILCKICEARQAILNEKFFAWLDAQANSVTIMEREADTASIYQAHDLLKIDPAESFRQYLALAERGSVWSMANVGHLFENGTGTAKDLAQAEKWYLRAYEAGSDYGLIWLGLLYQESGRYEKAQQVFQNGVERGFVPAMLRLAASYWNSPNWPQRRDEALTLLERGSAAGDLSARRYLAVGMMRGWFGLTRIPDGIRLVFSTAEDMANLVKDETATSPSERKTGPGLFNRLAAQLWLLDATRHPASR